MVGGILFGGSRAFRLPYPHSAGARVGWRREDYPAATLVGQGKIWRKRSSDGGIPVLGCLTHTARGREWVRGGGMTLPPTRSGRVRIGGGNPSLGESRLRVVLPTRRRGARVGKRRKDYPAAISVGQGKSWGEHTAATKCSSACWCPITRSEEVLSAKGAPKGASDDTV